MLGRTNEQRWCGRSPRNSPQNCRPLVGLPQEQLWRPSERAAPHAGRPARRRPLPCAARWLPPVQGGHCKFRPGRGPRGLACRGAVLGRCACRGGAPPGLKSCPESAIGITMQAGAPEGHPRRPGAPGSVPRPTSGPWYLSCAALFGCPAALFNPLVLKDFTSRAPPCEPASQVRGRVRNGRFSSIPTGLPRFTTRSTPGRALRAASQAAPASHEVDKLPDCPTWPLSDVVAWSRGRPCWAT